MPDQVESMKETIESLKKVDRLIIREKDPEKLIDGACHLIAGMDVYNYSWILLMDSSGNVTAKAESGIGEDFHNLTEMIAASQLPPCVDAALNSDSVVTNRADTSYCKDCRLKEEPYMDMESCITRLEHEGRVFGVFAVGFEHDSDMNETSRSLFLEIADDIAYALHVRELNIDRDRSLASSRDSEALLNAFLEHFPGPAFIRDSESRYLHVNKYFRDRFGPLEKWVGRTPAQLFPGEFGRRMMTEDAAALEKGYHVYEKQLGSGDDASTFEIHCFRIDREDKDPLMGGIAVDITDWYKSKHALEESEEKYRAVFQNTGSATVIVGPDKTIELANHGFERLSGYASEEVCGKMKWTDFVIQEDLDRMVGYHEERRSTVSKAPTSYEFHFRDRKGDIKNIKLQVDMIPGTGKSVCSLIDITQLKETQEQLNKSLQNVETLLRTMPDIMFILSREGEYIDYWVEDDSVLAIPPGQIIGSRISELGLPEHKIGEILGCIAETLETGEVQSVEYELEVGDALGFFEARFAPYFEDRVIAVIRDITARREAENKRLELEARIQHTQKLESLGVLAGGIAHDFNNILMTILGNADLAMLALPDTSPALGFLSEISNAASTASDLARQMLAYSGRSDFEIHPFDLNEVVLDLTHMLEVSISKKVVLKYRLADNLPPIMADSTQIRQIIMNLITNASEAVGDMSGYISITTGAMYCDEEYLLTTELTNEITEGIYVYLEVSDTGSGMDDSVRKQLFEPFFTTKYTGRGLGLSSVLGIVRGHKGAIKVYTEKGEGTTFKILIPAHNQEDTGFPASNGRGSEGEWQGQGTVLFADDEDTVLAVGRKMLEFLGFTVLTAKDGNQAVEIFRENSDDVVLAILDLTMPHLSGDEVYREMRRIRSDIPVIVSSGFSRKDVLNRFAGKHLAGFIQKPYRVDELAELIKSILDPQTDTVSE